MDPFLSQVARHYYAEGELERRCFIFPNRRALLFFRKYLSDEVKRTGRPMPVPPLFTVNDFFYKVAGSRAADRVSLLLDLYEVYASLRKSPEPLDDFIFWGDVLLSDFDDVDKYLVDPRALFTNVAEFRDLQDGSYAYLTDAQRLAVGEFLKHFRTEGERGAVKDSFLQLWNILLPLYEGFGRKLAASPDGRAYEGMVYRRLAERMRSESAVDVLRPVFPDTEVFVFIGLNALNECEKTVLRRMRDAHIAQFCWDFSGGMIRHPQNRSSFFMKDNITEFPQAFPLDPDGLPEPEFHVIGVPSATGGAKQLPGILAQARPSGLDTAVVLPDENLLLPVLNSIPAEIRDINVTMGHPMQGSEFHALMTDILALQLHLREKKGQWYFYYRQVWGIFSNSVFRAVADGPTREQVARIKSEAKYYIPGSDFRGFPLLELIFRPVVGDPAARSAVLIRELGDYQLAVISRLGVLLKGDGRMTLELDFARKYYQDVRQLMREAHRLDLTAAGYTRLLGRLVTAESVPFQGEPLGGLQVMGPLETRALDFRNLIVLSCNEGVFPRRNVSSSFIPPELRRGFGLPTYEHQDAMWAYYFYRMIQRASHVWLVYDSRQENFRSGEESRYIKQLELHFGIDLHRREASAAITRPSPPGPIPKTQEDLDVLQDFVFSASSLQHYLACPALFYYASVKGLKEEDEVAESLDAGSLGTVLHAVMEEIYGPEGRLVEVRDLDAWLRDAERLRGLIHAEIEEKLHAIEVSGRNLIFADVLFEYARTILRRDRELLREAGSPGFRILGLEKKLYVTIHGRRFKGFIDRLDSFRDGEVRISDYKTGRVSDDEIDITDETASTVVQKLFGASGKDRPKIALQLYIYDKLIEEAAAGRRVVHSLYPAVRLFVAPVPVIPRSAEFCALMDAEVARVLDEIFDPGRPFERTTDEGACEWCDFKVLCGR